MNKLSKNNSRLIHPFNCCKDSIPELNLLYIRCIFIKVIHFSTLHHNNQEPWDPLSQLHLIF